ncbi:DEAD/DEAH box helicase [Rapidithrix thailandica]|uniref:DEAD/DEAH box helicase n=1 Tax=Rapidithrix thailandica TaxID=413964 RepID=A0AAW9S811_9BACT
MSHSNNLVRYLKSCYQADNRELSLTNFFQQKVEHHYLLQETELFSGELSTLPADEEWAESVTKTLSVYSKEKELYTCALFVIGKAMIGGKEQKIIAPLLLSPTTIVEGEMPTLQLPAQNTQLNTFLFKLLEAQDDDDTSYTAINELSTIVNSSHLDFEQCAAIKNFFDERFEGIDTQDLLLYPQLYDKKKIDRKFKKLKEGFAILPAAGLAVLKKSTATLGVLNELSELEASSDYSAPLRVFLGADESAPSVKEESKQILVPTTLNAAQQSVFQSVNAHHATLLVGPPGTGKSFTIAALTVDYLARGKSVLIVSSNNQAVDVIADKIEKDFELKDVCIRGGGMRNYKTTLRHLLGNIINGVGVKNIKKEEITALEKKLEQYLKNIDKQERLFAKQEKRELERGGLLAQSSLSLLQKIKKWWTGVRLNFNLEEPYWEIYQGILREVRHKNETIKELVDKQYHYNLYQTLEHHRQELVNFYNAIRARTGNRKESLFDEINFDRLKKTLPVWLVSIGEINSVLPLRKELFDLVIIDEASQCDLASTLPVMQRGRKVVVSGDPKQLRHVSFLSRERQRYLGEQVDLTESQVEQYAYRDRSVLDVFSDQVQSQNQIAFLNEHFRSLPGIISFSNREFYADKLRIMTSDPKLAQVQSLFHLQVDGERVKQGYNTGEAEFILKKVEEMMEEEKNLEVSLCQSIGILSPYRNQVDYLRQQVSNRFDLESMERHNLLVGTAHSFQGEERDVMFLSFAIDSETHPSALQHINRTDVFNVSITRARSNQYVVTSLSKNQLPTTSMLGKYLSYIDNHSESTDKPNSYPVTWDEFLEEVRQTLTAWGVEELHVKYPVAGLEIDLVMVYQGKTYCIDLIGYPGEFEAAFSLEHYKLFVQQQAGFGVFPLPYSLWKLQRETTEQALKKYLGIGEIAGIQKPLPGKKEKAISTGIS